MVGRKPLGDKKMEKIFSMRVSAKFLDALEEAKWTLRKSMTDIVRESIVEYLERHLPKEALEKVRKILESETKEPKPKRRASK
jgi:flagellar motor component MotA